MPVTLQELNMATTCNYSALASKMGVTPRKLIEEIKLIAFSDLADHFEIAEGGEIAFKPFDKQGKHRRALKKIKEKTVITESKDGNQIYKTSTVECELHSKMEAIDNGLALHSMKAPKKVEFTNQLKVEMDIKQAELLAELRRSISEQSNVISETD